VLSGERLADPQADDKGLRLMTLDGVKVLVHRMADPAEVLIFVRFMKIPCLAHLCWMEVLLIEMGKVLGFMSGTPMVETEGYIPGSAPDVDRSHLQRRMRREASSLRGNDNLLGLLRTGGQVCSLPFQKSCPIVLLIDGGQGNPKTNYNGQRASQAESSETPGKSRK